MAVRVELEGGVLVDLWVVDGKFYVAPLGDEGLDEGGRPSWGMIPLAPCGCLWQLFETGEHDLVHHHTYNCA